MIKWIKTKIREWRVSRNQMSVYAANDNRLTTDQNIDIKPHLVVKKKVDDSTYEGIIHW